jgi:serine protease AprX
VAGQNNDGPKSGTGTGLPESDPTEKPFTPETLDRTVIAIPLLEKIEKEGPAKLQDVIIDVNLEYPGGREKAREIIKNWIDELTAGDPDQDINRAKSKYSQQYLFGRLSGRNIQALVERDLQHWVATGSGSQGRPALYRIWLDFEVKQFTNKSLSTVKADAARNAFGALGRDIVWAVVDTGIDSTHPHFDMHKNLVLEAPLQHRDFTGLGNASDDVLAAQACSDVAGHGTHVAGIIAGRAVRSPTMPLAASMRQRGASGQVERTTVDLPEMSGMAPECKLLSLKVLDDKGAGLASNLIAAIEYIQELNGNGRRLRVHGVNMSVGYDFEPKWFACGQSPLCVEVDRLVRTGVVVVVAAGNTGYGFMQTQAKGVVAAGLDLTINDPGNAELAITVGATHRESPHIYGVSYFSSKGPTGDGRLKPDLVAPGEKILSCRSRQAAPDPTPLATGDRGAPPNAALYKEDSGTSMAAPHVSGVIAAFLSVRREFIGQSTVVKDIFLSTATDLKRAVYFQGKGLVDLMRAIQSV